MEFSIKPHTISKKICGGDGQCLDKYEYVVGIEITGGLIQELVIKGVNELDKLVLNFDPEKPNNALSLFPLYKEYKEKAEKYDELMKCIKGGLN